MTLANDVRAKLAFQPGDATPLAMEIHELEEGLLAWIKICMPARFISRNEGGELGQRGINALFHDYLANGITKGMAARALLTVTQ